MAELVSSTDDPTTRPARSWSRYPDLDVESWTDAIRSSSVMGLVDALRSRARLADASNYDVQAVYEGINDWDASIVYPKQAITEFYIRVPALRDRR